MRTSAFCNSKVIKFRTGLGWLSDDRKQHPIRKPWVDLGDLSERIDALVDGVAVELDFHKICFEARELAEAAETMEQLAAVVAMRNRLEDPKYSQCRVPETLSAIDSLLTAKKQKILTEEIHALEARLRAEIQAAAELEDLGSEVEESLIRQFDSFASLDASTDFEIRSIARAKQKAVVEFIHERKTQLALDAVSLCFETFTTTLSTVDTLEGLGVVLRAGESVELHSLSQAHYNGQIGIVIGPSAQDPLRVQVRVF